MSDAWLSPALWLLRVAVGGGLVLLLTWAIVRLLRQPARRHARAMTPTKVRKAKDSATCLRSAISASDKGCAGFTPLWRARRVGARRSPVLCT